MDILLKVTIIAFLSLFVFANDSSISFGECRGVDPRNIDYYNSSIKFYEFKSKTTYSGDELDEYLEYYKKDCKDKKYIKRAEEEVKKLKKVGAQNELKFLTNYIPHVVKYRVPAKEMSQVGKLAKVLEKEITDFFSLEDFRKDYMQYVEKRKKSKDSCTPIDNRKYPLKNNIRDQDGIGWCYAYTAADLLSHKTGKLISAVDIANSFNNDNPLYNFLTDNILAEKESEQEGGHVNEAIKSALDKGLCLEKDIRSSDFGFQNYKEFLEALQDIEKLKEDYDDSTDVLMEQYTYGMVGYSYNSKAISDKKRKLEREFLGDCSRLNGEWRNIFRDLSSSDIVKILRKSNPTDVFNQMVNASCEKRLENLKFKIHNSNSWNVDKHVNIINEQLDKGNIVAISYKSTLLNDHRGELDGNHASSVVARKYDEKAGVCQFLIRNSWGDGCQTYDKKYECESGNIWVPEEDLTRMVYRTSYVE